MAEAYNESIKEEGTIDLSANVNTIEQMAVSELMDDRFFYIPCYQRGYRWGKTQIYDLCNDLLDYALKKEEEISEGIQNKSFYCLQPIIVIPKQFKLKGYSSRDSFEYEGETVDGVDVNGYEVVDGQQRLTSLYVLYRYLYSSKNNLTLLNMDFKQKLKKFPCPLFHVYYETRPHDYGIIKKIGYENLHQNEINDIDITHISNAYQYIDQWLSDSNMGALKTLGRYPNSSMNTLIMDTTKEKIIEGLKNLLDERKNSTKGSVQIIWYKLDGQKDAVKEFIKENTGKIKLTDAELIKGLFLQKRNWQHNSSIQQHSIGKDWELIENTLHRNDFWSFLSSDIHQEDNRINIVFEYIYQKYNNAAIPKDSQNALFRFYNEHFEQNGNMSVLWQEVKECFQAMQNWYNDPYIYNLVGLLSKHGESLYDIINTYNDNSVVTTEDFLWKLKESVLETLPKPVNNEDSDSIFPQEYFNLFYGENNDEIRQLLLFVNVRQLCKQLDKARIAIESGEKKSDKNRTEKDLMNHIYKFPYDVLDSFDWDIEHVDSATTNQMQKIKDKERWIAEAEKVLGETITKNNDYQTNKQSLANNPNNKDDILDEMIKLIKVIADDDIHGEGDDEEKKKNWIGNLTLLDSGTNRSYGNSLFVIKQKVIGNRIKDGVFVPICTRNVFDKKIPNCTSGSLQWDWNDKKCHHEYLLSEYNGFVNEINTHKEKAKVNSQKIGD